MAQGMTEKEPHVPLEFLKAVLDGHTLFQFGVLALGFFLLRLDVCLVVCIFYNTLCSGNIPVWPPDLHASRVRVRSV